MAARKKSPTATVPGLYTKNGRYYYQPPQKDGVRPKPIALRTADFAEAIRLRDQAIGRAFVAATTSPLRQLSKIYLAEKSASGEHRASTAHCTKNQLARFIARFPQSPGTITAQDVLAWRGELVTSGISLASVRAYMSAAKAFCAWLEQTGRLLRSPFAGLPKKAIPQHVPTRRGLGVTKAARDTLIQNCTDPDLRAVLFLGFHAGLRRGEILALRPSWLIPAPEDPRHIRVRNESGTDGTIPFLVKDGEAKTIPLNRPLREFLATYAPGKSPYVVAPEKTSGGQYRWDWKKKLGNYAKKQGHPGLTAHRMRHTYITLLLSAPPEIRPSLLHLERWTGTDTETLKKTYAHLFEDDDLVNASV